MSSTAHEREQERKVAVWVLLAAVIPLSPVALFLRPLTGNIFSLLCIAWIFFHYHSIRFTPSIYLAAIATIAGSLLCAAYWGQLKLAVLPIYFVSALLLVSRLDSEEIAYFADIASKVLVVMLVGCVIGFLYVFFGGQALIEFPNEDGRMNGLYLTTLSNSKVLNILRPAGIFDEPGTLSFVLCMIAAIRHSLRMDKRTTWIMLSLGLITFSMAQAVYVLLHLAAELKTSTARALKYTIGFVAIGTTVIAFVPMIYAVLSNNLFQRFVLQDGALVGDNRSSLFVSAVNHLNGRVFWWGLDADCITNRAACIQKGYDAFGENPLAPLVLYGVFNSWPYYMLQAALLTFFLWRRNLVAMGVFLVLLQRPNVMSYSYAILILLAFKAIWYSSVSRRDPPLVQSNG